MENTRENEQDQENRQAGDEKPIFPFIDKISVERDWEQVEEDSEEAYQGC